MATRLIVTTTSPDDIARVRASGASVLADYPDAVLVDATAAQRKQLTDAGLETVAMPTSTVQTASARFTFADAQAADLAAPIVSDPSRVAYFLVQLVGPVKQDWLTSIVNRGGRLQGTLSGYRLLVGMTPAAADAVAGEPFVDAITPYRPAMKVSPALRADVAGRELGVDSLTSLDLVGSNVAAAAGAVAGDAKVQVQVTVFSGESTQDVAAEIRASGGTVLSTSDRTVIASTSLASIVSIADRQGIEAILPHSFPEPTNDRAAGLMHVPVDHTFATFTLTGAGQVVGIADSGIDTGAAATMHPDLAGRVTIVSSPNQFASLTTDPAPFDDGAADELGHGTHVAGSVAGNGAAAIAAGSTTVPTGIAPGVTLHFTAIGQRVTWGPTAPAGLAPWGLYGIPADLNNLFGPAYVAGARIHTNSWGSSNSATNLTIEGSYDSNAREVDDYSSTHRDALVLFSAGNNGRDNNADAQIDGDSIGTPGTAKNCLTVGASENNRPSGSMPTPGVNGNWTAAFGTRFAGFAAAGHVSNDGQGMALFSSRGPTDDGRRKPDLVAPGTNILSVRSSAYSTAIIGAAATRPILWGEVAGVLNGDYCWSGGTSMSTPLVAGAAALIRQHLVTQRGHHQDGVTPSGALVKAMLVNGAVPIAGQYPGEVPADPNSVDGFGLVDMVGSLTPGTLGQTLFCDDPTLALSSMQTRTFSVQAVDLGQPMKITLVWTDPPSPVGVGGLQNQLSLQLVPPGGMPTVEADITPFPNPTNNVQRIIVAAPVGGSYEIRIRSANVVTRSAGAGAPAGLVQDFALAASNIMGLATNPVTVAMAIDTTGSMSYYGFIEPAKERARQLVDFLRGGDRVSVSEFSARGLPADGRTPYPVRSLSSFTPDWTDAHTAIGGLTAAGNTPIGAGLLAAWTQLSGEAAGRPTGIVLLSDGFNNTMPDPASILPTIPSTVPIFAVALGPAASTPALMAISGSRPNGAYFSVDSDDDVHHLHEIYASLQAMTSGGALLGLDTAMVDAEVPLATDVAVEPGLSSITFTTSWTASAKLRISVIDPGGVVHDVGTAGTEVIDGPNHRHVRIAVPMAGIWQLRVASRSKKPAMVTTSASAPSPLVLTAEMRQRSATKATVFARLLSNGSGIDDSTVTARILVPHRSLADVLERHGKQLAKLRIPKQLDEPGLTASQRQLIALAALGMQYRSQPGGLFDRQPVDVVLKAVGNGRYTGDTATPVPGSMRIDVRAKGDMLGFAYQRHTQRSVLVAGRPVRPTKPVKPSRSTKPSRPAAVRV
ncbi:MAG: S8 family serine peptidase [Ilumatobacteraceae bacterium]